MSEKEVEYRIPEYPNKEKGFIFDEEKFGEFSSEIFNKPFIAILCAIYLNFVYIYSWSQNMNFITSLLSMFIRILIIRIMFNKYFKPKKEV